MVNIRRDTRNVVCMIIPDEKGRILLIKRGEPPKLGYWTVPEGHVKMGESIVEAARREALEEIEADITIYEGFALVITGMPNDYLEDEYAIKAEISGNRIGEHTFQVLNEVPFLVREPDDERFKNYIYIVARISREPRITPEAQAILWISPLDVIELSSKGKFKVEPTTLLMLKILHYKSLVDRLFKILSDLQ
ncbi:MAG: hypothetical protein DRM97_06850 [Thermoprotei archaeon]|nr:MAG: hypothetical protein DRM97_06850 [Thermoprotei archaeon]